MDRHHNRYWILPAHRGIYVEKGWIGDYINYQYTPDITEGDEAVVMDTSDKSTLK